MTEHKITQILINESEIKFSKYGLEAINSLKKFFFDYEYKLYSDKEIIDFLKNNFSSEVLNSYHKLKPFSYKADLAKYSILYKKGGWYVDIGIKFLKRVDIGSNIDLVCFRDDQRHSKTSWAVCPGIFYSKPGNPILKFAIDLVIRNCKEEWYGKTPLCPTGPSVFGQSIAVMNRNLNLMIGDLIRPKVPFTNKDLPYFKRILKSKFKLDKFNNIALLKPYNGGDLSSIVIKGSNNYNEFWHSKDIYKKT